MNKFNGGHQDAIYGVPWVWIDDWRSSTTQGLHVLDLGTVTLPKGRGEVHAIAGRDGFIVNQKQGFDGYERVVVFLAETQRALRLLYNKLESGKSYPFVFSSDPAFIHHGYVTNITLDKVPHYKTKVTVTIQAHPYKVSRDPMQYALAEGETTIDNLGDAESYPVITLHMTSQSAKIEVNQSYLEVLSAEGEAIIIDSEKQEARRSNGDTANHCLRRGYFPALSKGKNKIKISGASASMSIRWRYWP